METESPKGLTLELTARWLTCKGSLQPQKPECLDSREHLGMIS